MLLKWKYFVTIVISWHPPAGILLLYVLMKRRAKHKFSASEYEHPVEAVQAISMLHNQTYYDRKMSVRMDRVTEKESTTTKLPPGLKSLGMGLGVNGSALTDVASKWS